MTGFFANKLPSGNLLESATLYPFTFKPPRLFYDAPMAFESGNMFCSKCLMKQGYMIKLGDWILHCNIAYIHILLEMS